MIEKLAAIIESNATKDIPWETLKPCNLFNRTLRTMVPKPTCGKILLHAKRQVSAFKEHFVGVLIFKIGVTADPLQRFITYLNKNFTTMWVIFSGDDIGVVHMLEAALIGEFGDTIGCKNTPNSGGEGALNRTTVASPPYYVYIVGGRADQMKWVGWVTHNLDSVLHFNFSRCQGRHKKKAITKTSVIQTKYKWIHSWWLEQIDWFGCANFTASSSPSPPFRWQSIWGALKLWTWPHDRSAWPARGGSEDDGSIWSVLFCYEYVPGSCMFRDFLLRPFVNHIKGKLRKQERDLEKKENPQTPAPKSTVKTEPGSKKRRQWTYTSRCSFLTFSHKPKGI